MTYFPDLTPYSYGQAPEPADARLLNVGWLDAENPYPTGDTPSGLLQGLAHLCEQHAAGRTRGWHACELQHAAEGPGYPVTVQVDGKDMILGSAELRVTAADGTSFAAPNMILHYVLDHGYLPPRVFVDAVMAHRPDSSCPG